jgi:hypothetical protein
MSIAFHSWQPLQEGLLFIQMACIDLLADISCLRPQAAAMLGT